MDAALNVTGGVVGPELKVARSEMNISGGTVEYGMEISRDSRVEIDGGVIHGFDLFDGGEAYVTGGHFSPGVTTREGSTLTLVGKDFQLDGEPITSLPGGLPTVTRPGDRRRDMLGGSVLTGTLQDGSVFIFSTDVGDWFDSGTVDLVETEVPAPGPALINVPHDPAPTGLRSGQTLNLADGGALPDHFAAVNAKLNIAGGSVGAFLEVAQSEVNVSGGQINGGMDVHLDSVVTITGGTVRSGMNVGTGSAVSVTGGDVGSIAAHSDRRGSISWSNVRIAGGTVGHVYAGRDSVVEIVEGSLGRVTVDHNSIVRIWGGTFADENSLDLNGENVHFYGLDFRFDGVDLTETLDPHETISVTLSSWPAYSSISGRLADGSEFDFRVRPGSGVSTEVTFTLVPEPGGLGLLGMGGLAVLGRRRRRG